MSCFQVKSAALAAAFLFACVQSGVAGAQGFISAKEARVNLRDMDLSREQDVVIVRGRIHAAVADVCEVKPRDVSASSRDQCVARALAAANATLSTAMRQARKSAELKRLSQPVMSERQ